MPEMKTKEEASKALVKKVQVYRNALAAQMPRQINKDRMLMALYNEIGKNPDLAECSEVTIWGSLMSACRWGIEVGLGNNGWLIPMWVSQRGRKECQLWLGYDGLRNLAMRSGKYSYIYSRPVFDGDDFYEEQGSEPKLHHRPKPPPPQDPEMDPTDWYNLRAQTVVAHYCIVKLVGEERPIFRVMWAPEIARIRAAALARKKKKTSGPWIEHPIAMGNKTVLRATCWADLEKTPELTMAVLADMRAESGKPQELEEEAPEKIPDRDDTIHVLSPPQTDQDTWSCTCGLEFPDEATARWHYKEVTPDADDELEQASE